MSNVIDFDSSFELSRCRVRLRARPAGPRQRRPVDRRSDPAAVRAGVRQRRARPRSRIRRPSASPATTALDGTATGVHDRFLRGAAAVLSRAATSASWRCTAPSTTWPSAARRRSICRPRSSSKKACRWTTSSASSPRCGRRAPRRASALVTGDTKVVDRGKGDQVFITTIGHRPGARRPIALDPLRPGPAIASWSPGTIGDHGIAIMSVREGIEFETVLESDTAPLNDLTRVDARGLPADPLHARPDPRRRVECPQRTGGGLAGRRRARRGRDSGAARSARRLRDARPRPAVRRQRRKADRRRSARTTPTACSR